MSKIRIVTRLEKGLNGENIRVVTAVDALKYNDLPKKYLAGEACFLHVEGQSIKYYRYHDSEKTQTDNILKAGKFYPELDFMNILETLKRCAGRLKKIKKDKWQKRAGERTYEI